MLSSSASIQECFCLFILSGYFLLPDFSMKILTLWFAIVRLLQNTQYFYNGSVCYPSNLLIYVLVLGPEMLLTAICGALH